MFQTSVVWKDFSDILKERKQIFSKVAYLHTYLFNALFALRATKLCINDICKLSDIWKHTFYSHSGVPDFSE